MYPLNMLSFGKLASSLGKGAVRPARQCTRARILLCRPHFLTSSAAEPQRENKTHHNPTNFTDMIETVSAYP